MTPVAGPGASKRAPRAGAASAADPRHRRPLRQRAAPGQPRRVSGPLGGRLASPAPERQRPTPRPDSTRRSSDTGAAPRLSTRAIAFVCALPDRSLLDRIVRGRAWIPLLGLMLAGIVAMQVEVLKLGASIGRSIERSSALQTRNETLRATLGALDDDQRVESVAAKSGMVMPAPQAVGFLSAGSDQQVQRAVANIHVPDPAAFLATTSANGSVVGAPGAADAAGGQSSGATSAGLGAGTAGATVTGNPAAATTPASTASGTATATGTGTATGTTAATGTGIATGTTAGTATGTATASGNITATRTPSATAATAPTTNAQSAGAGPTATTASSTGG
jgi:hypothetical protein